MNNGLNKKEAEAMVSKELGHRDGRGDYVRSIYN